MKFQLQCWQQPKDGNTSDENEDGFAFAIDRQMLRVALCDGAADSFQAQLWAKAIAQNFAHNPPQWPEVVDGKPTVTPIALWVQALADDYNAQIPWDSLAWYQEEKAKRGDAATLLGIEFTQSVSSTVVDLTGRWRALAIGDCCLFQVRDKKLFKTFPLKNSSDFDLTPALLSTGRNNLTVIEELQTESGTFQEEDLFFLATDTVAKWLFTEVEAGHLSWKEVAALNQEAFAELVSELRTNDLVRNDDMTLIVLSIESDSDDNIVEEIQRSTGGDT